MLRSSRTRDRVTTMQEIFHASVDLPRHMFSHGKTCFNVMRSCERHASNHANNLGKEEKGKRKEEMLLNSMYDIDGGDL